MQERNIRALYYITHIDNLPSILEHGIFSNEVKEIVNNPKITVDSQPDMFFQPRKRTEIGQHISLIDGGDIFFSELQTLTVTVNLKGIMGKGLALRAKDQFPDVYVEYGKACRSKKVTSARPYIYKREVSVTDELMDLIVNSKNKWTFAAPPVGAVSQPHWCGVSN